jgi:aryl-alcohol dehydrogenase-like predicted oxidoreductase
MGRLTGKYSVSNPPPDNRRFSNIPMEQLEPLLNVMRKIAKSHDVPVSAVALGWVMAKGAIPLGGARNKQQAEQVSSKAY